MKKLLLTAAAGGLLFSANAFAAEADTFYVQAGGGASWFSKIKDKATSYKLKGKTTFNGDVGFGYNILDNARAGLDVVFVASPEQKKNATDAAGLASNVKHKANIMAFLISGEVDLFDVSIAKVSFGAGVGLSRLKEKVTLTEKQGNRVFVDGASLSSKNKNNLGYRVQLAVSTEVAPSVGVALTVGFADYGTTKSVVDKNDVFGYGPKQEVSKSRWKAFETGLRVRVDL